MRILAAPELKQYLAATCVYDVQGKPKPLAQRHGLLALNVYADAWLIAAMAVSADLQSPLILESSPRVFGEWGAGAKLAGVLDAAAYLDNAARYGGWLDRVRPDGTVVKQPFQGAAVALACDHVTVPSPGADYEAKLKDLLDYAEGAITSGHVCYFMIDAGKLPLPENIKLTRHIVQMGRAHEVLVEGEFSVIGGVEDREAHLAASEIPVEENAQGILHFIKETEVDVIAYDFGTLHGARSDQKQRLNSELLMRVNELLYREGCWRPTTGHGGTSVSDQDTADHRGLISKLNKATIGKVVAVRYMRDFLVGNSALVDAEDKQVCDPGRLIYGCASPLADMCEGFVRMLNATKRI